MPIPIKPVAFVTFGMFIVDEIEWQTKIPQPSKHNLIGGAGTYAVLGARLAATPCQVLSRSISWIVDVGSDFPEDIRQTIDSWGTDCIFRTDLNRLTTRAWNGYGENEFRSFRYLTPKIRLEVSSLIERQLRSKSFHMVCSPDRSLELTANLEEARDLLDPKPRVQPIIVWEPIPDLCSPAEIQRLQDAATQCTIVSPNHDELRMFFAPETTVAAEQQNLARKLMGWDVAPRSRTETKATSPVLVVREGSNGSTAYFRDDNPLHVPAYHNHHMSKSVVDPTGGGNTYLGAMAIALTGDLFDQPTYEVLKAALRLEPANGNGRAHQELLRQMGPHLLTLIAMIYATIAASFAIEQHGTPSLVRRSESIEITEYWNGQTPIDRLRIYLEREGDYIRQQIG